MNNWQNINRALFSGGEKKGISASSAEKLLEDVECVFRLVKEFENRFPPEDLKNVALVLLKELLFALKKAEEQGIQRVEVRNLLAETWRIHGLSSFGHHIQAWPYGFPGDFKVINMIVDQQEYSSPGTLQNAIGNLALASPIAEQHRQKLALQAGAVLEVCKKNKSPRIMSLACGASRDLESIKDCLAESKAKITLVDFDQDALDESVSRLDGLNIKTIKVDVRRLFARLQDEAKECGEYNLAYAGGLFDYFNKALVERTIKCLFGTLCPGGSLLFTNIAQGNPFRLWIETMGNWKLIERSEKDMIDLISVLSSKQHELFKDPTGLTWIARAWK